MSNQNNALEQAFEGLSFEIQTEIFRPGEKVVAGYLPNKFLVVAKQKAGDDKVTAYIYKPSAEGGEVVFKPVSSHMDGAKGINAALRSAAGITTEKQL